MIDWYSVFANSLWILGLALALATFSYVSWLASIQGVRTRDQLKTPGTLIAFSIAGILFCAGLAATSDTLIEIVIWSILGVLFLVQAIMMARQRTKSIPEATENRQKEQDTP